MTTRTVPKRKRLWNRNYWGQPREIRPFSRKRFMKSIDNAIEKAKDESPAVELAERFMNSVGSLLHFPKNLSKQALINFLTNYYQSLRNRVRSEISAELKDVAEDAIKQAEQNLGITIRFGSGYKFDPKFIDNTLKLLLPQVEDSISEQYDSSLDKVEAFFADSSKTHKRSELRELLSEIRDDTDAHLETIARTVLSSGYFETARAFYEEQVPRVGLDADDLVYKWVNPIDYRTTDTCKNIYARTRKGVSMEELKKIVKEESEKEFKGFFKMENPLMPHWNCRSTFVGSYSKP